MQELKLEGTDPNECLGIIIPMAIWTQMNVGQNRREKISSRSEELGDLKDGGRSRLEIVEVVHVLSLLFYNIPRDN